ncbi:hypothetical protein E4665_17210 [Sporolactobacillus shoreae]|uniref:Uncharacterized protein n=1 Tax=Sporolactobacillus shoreae TaxID=1465501 RepID=A0A4Z0GJV4_9BACL|nr:hypothetical protein [Sporolactobacillus shoreae]TGA95895.1 hypothetical protein E4665_17210 [Sporolactobacillus shoreae]
MNVKNFSNAGDKLYLMHKEVVVIRVYEMFQLLKIRYTDKRKEFFVDICAVTHIPDDTDSISLGLLRRDNG